MRETNRTSTILVTMNDDTQHCIFVVETLLTFFYKNCYYGCTFTWTLEHNSNRMDVSYRKNFVTIVSEASI